MKCRPRLTAVAVAMTVTAAGCDTVVQRRSELPKAEQLTLARIPANQLCGRIEVSNALQAFNSELKDVSKMTTEELTRATQAMADAPAIDLAREFRARGQEGGGGRFRALWVRHHTTVDALAKRSWRDGPVSDDERNALLELDGARKADLIDALIAGYRSTPTGKYADAYRMHVRPSADSSRLLPGQSESSTLSMLLAANSQSITELLGAHTADAAEALEKVSRRLDNAEFQAIYQLNRETVPKVAALDWRKDNVLMASGAAICELLRAYERVAP